MGLTTPIYLRVRPPSSNDRNNNNSNNNYSSGVAIHTDPVGNSVTVSGAIGKSSGTLQKRTFFFKQVFSQDDPIPALEPALIKPHTLRFIKGYNASILCLGATGAGKSTTLDACVQCFLNIVFGEGGGIGGDRALGDGFTLNLQAYEVYGELVRDLLESQREGLNVVEDQTLGYIVPTAKSITIYSMGTGLELLQKISKNKRSTYSDNNNPTSTADKSFTIYRFTLKSRNQETKAAEFYSKFTFVEGMGAEVVLEDATRLMLRDGPYVAQSAKVWRDVILASGPFMAQNFDHDQSIITQLLSEELGGNAYTSTILCINPSHPTPLTFAVLDMTINLKNMVTYPVRNEGNVFALMSFLRSKRIKVGEEMAARLERVRNHEVDIADGKDVAESLEIASDRATELQEECDKLKRRLAELNARYDAVVDAKSGYERSHDEQDEQALELKRALLDSQIEHADALAAVEAKNMDLMNKMVEYESHGNELDMRLKSIQEEAQLLKSENGKLRKLNQQLTSDNAILRENFNNTDSDNQTLRRRIDDLSVEIVSLVNAKSALLAEKEGKMLEIEKLQKHNLYIQQRLENHQSNGFETSSEMQELRSKLERMRMDFSEEKRQLEDKLIMAEKDKVQLEKQLINKAQYMDKELQETKFKYTNESGDKNRLQKTVKELEFDNSVMKKELETEKANSAERIKTEQRLKSSLAQLENEMKEMTSNYRTKLEKFIREIMRISEDKGPTLKSDGVTLREIKALVDNMFKEILQSYINRERQYLEELAYLRSSTGGENGVGSYNSNNKSSSFAKQPTADFGGDDMFDSTGSGLSAACQYCKDSSYKRLKKELKEFMLNSQESMERERTKLLVRCTIAENQNLEFQRQLNL